MAVLFAVWEIGSLLSGAFQKEFIEKPYVSIAMAVLMAILVFQLLGDISDGIELHDLFMTVFFSINAVLIGVLGLIGLKRSRSGSA